MLNLFFIYYTVYLATANIVLAVKNLLIKDEAEILEVYILYCLHVFSAFLVCLYSFQPVSLILNLIANLTILWLTKQIFKNHSFSGLNFYLANIYSFVIGISWGYKFLLNLHISSLTHALLICTTPFLLITLPVGFINTIEQFDVLCRNKWARPNKPYPKRSSNFNPKVTLLMPTYAEPPAIVIDSLKHLNALNYSNLEVIVIDNNTQNPNLYMPVKDFCDSLNPKFKFYHVEGIKGAKAGALNYVHKYISPDTEVVGVIDSDYNAAPNFINALIGYFDNPKMGFVQTPHDYRGWKGNLFLTMCYWEYKIFFYTNLVSMNEHSSTLTVGTMCLIRKKALEEAGGWSEWCVTEDSELAIRIHDLGYESVYVGTSFGKGLIPDTFLKYKKQRYRWTAGPVQEFLYHAEHLLGFSKKYSKYTFLQRIHHLNHGINNVVLGIKVPFTIISLLTIGSMVAHQEVVNVSFELWLAATVILISGLVMDVLVHTTIIKPIFWEYIGKTLASNSLNHIITLSAFTTSLTGSAKWTRTDKFKLDSYSYWEVLETNTEEIVIGILLTTFIIVGYLLLPFAGLSLMFLIGISYLVLAYFCAPLLSFVSVYSAKKLQRVRIPFGV